jgi:hypothetical protein
MKDMKCTRGSRKKARMNKTKLQNQKERGEKGKEREAIKKKKENK